MKRFIKQIALLMTFALFAAGVMGCGAEEVSQAVSTAVEVAEILLDTEEEAEVEDPAEESGKEDTEDREVSSETTEESSSAEEIPGSDVPDEAEELYIDPDGSYDSAEDVALYLYLYKELPSNYITKKEAQDLGWSGGSVEQYAEGKCIGGSNYGNYEGILPEGKYHECDIDTLGASSRGTKRIVYSTDGNIYYTDDHYETFTLLYTAEGPVTEEIVYQ